MGVAFIHPGSYLLATANSFIKQLPFEIIVFVALTFKMQQAKV